MHNADVAIRLQNAGPFAALKLAAERGDIELFRNALRQTYSLPHVCQRVFDQTIDDAYEYAISEVERLMDSAYIARLVNSIDGNEKTLSAWVDVVQSYEKRHHPV